MEHEQGVISLYRNMIHIFQKNTDLLHFIILISTYGIRNI